MSVKLEKEPGSARTGTAKRWFGWRAASGAIPGANTRVEPQGAGPTPEGEAIGRFIGELVGQGRYAFTLLQSAADHVSEEDVAAPAWKALERDMAARPLWASHGGSRPAEPQEMVDSARVLAGPDRRHQPAVRAIRGRRLLRQPRALAGRGLAKPDAIHRPRGPPRTRLATWSNGTFPRDKANHPVAGVCCRHEAAAYARWVGKRLPNACEWQKAGGWPEHLAGGTCTRYPWGDLFDPTRANLWHSAVGDTAAVDEFPGGDTPNGIHQMSGNVWEWLDDPLDAIPCRDDEVFLPQKPMRRVIGGAFDTYFLAEATCHFVTGQAELERRDNVGFRCAHLPPSRAARTLDELLNRPRDRRASVGLRSHGATHMITGATHL